MITHLGSYEDKEVYPSLSVEIRQTGGKITTHLVSGSTVFPPSTLKHPQGTSLPQSVLCTYYIVRLPVTFQLEAP